MCLKNRIGKKVRGQRQWWGMAGTFVLRRRVTFVPAGLVGNLSQPGSFNALAGKSSSQTFSSRMKNEIARRRDLGPPGPDL
jgi:hypothetical protein